MVGRGRRVTADGICAPALWAQGDVACLVEGDMNIGIEPGADCGTPGRKTGLESMMRQATAGRDDWSTATTPSLPQTGSSVVPVMTDSNSEAQRELWNRVRARLKTAVGEDVFASWFARLELEEIVDDLVHLSAPTRFLCSWVQSN
jgi:hypothetical protein